MGLEYKPKGTGGRWVICVEPQVELVLASIENLLKEHVFCHLVRTNWLSLRCYCYCYCLWICHKSVAFVAFSGKSRSELTIPVAATKGTGTENKYSISVRSLHTNINCLISTLNMLKQ